MRIIYWLFMIGVCWPLNVLAGIQSVAFLYGPNPPLTQTKTYDIVVVHPDSSANPITYRTPHSELYAYVSVGEVAETSPYYRDISNAWLMGKNQIWQSHVLDQTNPQWHAYFIKNILGPLWKKGYRGFFLDTLDSYVLAAKSPAEEAKQLQGLVLLIQEIKKQYPTAKLIFNRGFDLIPKVQLDVNAVAVESLFASWDQKNKRYIPVSQSDRDYLLAKLKNIQNMHIPVIVIDYLPPERKSEARELATKIKKLGMIPWIATGDLEKMGVGGLSYLPRKIFVLYTKYKQSTFSDQSAVNLLALPLQYLGYIPEYHDANQSLPNNIDPLEYAGVAVWAAPQTPAARKAMFHWLLKPMNSHIPIVFMTGFGFETTPDQLARFQLKSNQTTKAEKSVRISVIDKAYLGYEVQPYANKYEFFPLKAIQGKVLLQIEASSGQVEDAVAITPWGGYALYPYVTIDLPSGETTWVINPILFLQRALRLRAFPVPDVTTENGRRLLFAHVDGDGFATRPEFGDKEYAAEVLKNSILDVYQIPTTISVITSDIMPTGFNRDISADLISIAKSIFALPWVEPASHTYSHPFDWILVAKYLKSGKYNLPIPGYLYRPQAEITDSINYINDHLLPANKSTELLLWSGHANPTEYDIGLVYAANVGNLNGGQTSITKTSPLLAMIGPYGINVGPYYQTYAPISNEEPYTNVWSEPKWGFQRVIETFELTDKPIRFKPIDIYYHFYSASTNASMIALKKVYDWALQQETMPIFASEYVEKMLDATNMIVTPIGDGWQITTSGFLRELRVPKAFGYPDLLRSRNVIGFKQINDDLYLHLGSDTVSTIYFAPQPPQQPYLVSANARIKYNKQSNNGFEFELQGYAPLELELANMDHCILLQKKFGSERMIEGKASSPHSIRYSLKDKESHELRISCQ